MPTSGNSLAGELSGELVALELQGELRTYPAGATVFFAGDPGDGFYIVESGQIRISGVVGPNETRMLATIGTGDYFGEMAVVDDAPRSATATAEIDSRTIFLKRDTLLQRLEQRPQLALQLIRKFSNRMRALDQKYQDEVVQAERLAMIGRFASTIVHDFKNPLAVIGLAAELACSDHATPQLRQKAQSRIAQQVEIMTNMLHELIEFTKPSGQRPNLRAVDFSRYLIPFAAELRQELTERRVELVLEHEPPVIELRVEPQRLSRLFRNLVYNAVDEMPDGGKIFLRCRPTAAGLQVDVEDTGNGIAPEIAAKLFTPFATFGKAHGTGLGLTICKRIVEDHGGTIWAAPSEPGKGATFSFTLPRSP